jgi:uncharacterized protein YqjF (DUF2071 family)
MKLPTIEGIIRRRILVNYRVDPAVVAKVLPSRFRPKLQDGQAVAGVCLIRLEHIRPKLVPEVLGISSENAAHRIAVLWEEPNGVTREGVFIPRRDTNSLINRLVGGRLFPGEHHDADFKVVETDREIALSVRSLDGEVAVNLAGSISDKFPSTSIFRSLDDASSFFESGSVGYSVTSDNGRLDGVKLNTIDWRVEYLEVSELYSSYFADTDRFPQGSAEFDHALLMRNISHQWHSVDDLLV